jgi:hypothetical protein
VSVIASLVVLGFSSAAFGIPPEKINRDPFRFTGFAMAECPGFTVMWDGTIENTIINFFDKNGVMTRRHIHTAFTDSVFYNSSDPSYFVAGTPVNIQNDQLDFVNMIRMVSGLPVNITVPGYGVIWHWPGHVIINMLTGEVVFRSTADSARYNHDDLSALCAYLAQD